MDNTSIVIISVVMAIFIGFVVFIALNPPTETDSTETIDNVGGTESVGETDPDQSGF